MSPESFQQVGEIPTAVLAMLANRLLRDPLSPTPGPRLDHLADSEAAALALLQRTLGISDQDLRAKPEAQIRLLGEISRLLSQLAPDKRQEAASRLGYRGLLRPTDYAVEFVPDWQRFEDLFQERRASIEDVVSTTNFYRHLVPDKRGVPDYPAVTLLGKRISSKRTDPFVMLVVAERLASVLRVHSAWRIPIDFVPPTPDPLNLLERFVDQFGAFIRIPNRPSKQFLYYDEVVLDGSVAAETFPLAVEHTDAPTVGTAVFRVSQNGILEVAMAFAINVNPYKKFLRSLK